MRKSAFICIQFCKQLKKEFKKILEKMLMNKESQQAFARVNVSFPPLSSISVCIRVQWNPEWNEVSTIFSYAAPVFTNEFQLRGQVDMQGRILLALIIHGKHLPYKASFKNDGAWHHICVMWRRSRGHWAIYVDGDRKDMGSGMETFRDIFGEGILILGQDQDSFGGNFTEPFYGNITDLNVWNMSLEKRHKTYQWLVKAGLKGQHRGTDNGSTRTELEHKINTGRGLPHQTGPKVQTVQRCP
uniref:Pentraxin family member n=1 Tax=Mola mola TaxID=94237 RepID=A0A3Q3W6R8_MOLML